VRQLHMPELVPGCRLTGVPTAETFLMRTQGTLTRWNDDRGFGFISPTKGGGEIFVHISAFPRDGKRPQINERISYEMEAGADGKLRAVRVIRPREQATSHQPRSQSWREAKSRSFGHVFVLMAITAIGAYGYLRLSGTATSASMAEPSTLSSSAPSVANFKCDGRTMCSQMTSCAEARYFLQHCFGTKMDGDNDGKPCEQQWCN
jgi:cold shock CspA family protein